MIINKNINKQLSSINFVSLQICFGRFDTAVQLSGEGSDKNWVLTTPIYPLKDELGHVIHGKFQSKVSLVHNCDGNCMYTNGAKQVVEERETITSERITYEHDYTNKRYILNRFYLGEAWKYIPDQQ